MLSTCAANRARRSSDSRATRTNVPVDCSPASTSAACAQRQRRLDHVGRDDVRRGARRARSPHHRQPHRHLRRAAVAPREVGDQPDGRDADGGVGRGRRRARRDGIRQDGDLALERDDPLARRARLSTGVSVAPRRSATCSSVHAVGQVGALDGSRRRVRAGRRPGWSPPRPGGGARSTAPASAESSTTTSPALHARSIVV